jgi:hypothetical protein
MGAGIFPPWIWNYFTTRKIRRIARPTIISINPTLIKSIDFTSCANYILRAGCFHPAGLINQFGQSGLGLTLRGLPGLPRLQASLAGFFYQPSSSSPPCGRSRRPDTINIQLVVYFVKQILQKKQQKTTFSSTDSLGRGYFLGVLGLAGLALGGRPMGASRIASSADLSYSDSCVFGFKPLRNNRSFTVLRGKLSISAISEAVYPSMFIFSDYIQKTLKNIAKKHHFSIDKVKLFSYT